MPPDIRTGLMTTAPSAPSGGKATAPPGGDPLAAIFAALLERGGPTVPLPSLALKQPAASDQAAPTTASTTQEKKTKDQAAPTALPSPFWELTPLKLPQLYPLDPHGPLMPGGVMGNRKTMDTVVVPSSPPREKKAPAGELPLRLARADAPVAFPLFVVVPPLLTVALPSGVALPAAVPAAADAAGPAVQKAIASTAPQASVGLNTPLPVRPSQAFSLPAASLPLTPAPAMERAVAGDQPAVDAAPTASAVTVPPGVGTATPAVPGKPPRPNPGGLEVGPLTSPLALSPPSGSPELGRGGLPAAPAAVAPAALELQAATVTVRWSPPSDTLALVAALAARLGAVPRDGVSAGETGPGDAKQSPPSVRTAASLLPSLSAPAVVPPVPDMTAASPPKPGAMAAPVSTPGMDRPVQKSLKPAAQNADNNTRITGIQAQAALPSMPATIKETTLANLGLTVVGKRTETAKTNDAAGPMTPPLVPTQAEASKTAPLTRAERTEMVRQVADGAGGMYVPTRPGQPAQMTLQLHPHDWGRLQVSVQITPAAHPAEAQTVTAHLVAETPQIKAALEGHTQELRHALREAGLHLDRVSVTVQSAAAGTQAGMSGGRQPGADSGGQAPGQAAGQAPGQGAAMSAGAGPHGGRQDGNPHSPPAYAAAYAPPEGDGTQDEIGARPRLTAGQVDTRA